VGRIREGWAARGYGLFALEHAGTGAFVGMCGLSVPTFLLEVLPAVEIGWRLGREFWAQGLATEAARAVLRDAFEHHRLDSIISIHQVGNDASANIMRKLGMRFDRATVDPSCNRPVHVHAIARSEYINAMEGTSRA
jgi:RimJ/RimL family protein N-acetyltransferase